jgi:hypothetical protein
MEPQLVAFIYGFEGIPNHFDGNGILRIKMSPQEIREHEPRHRVR